MEPQLSFGTRVALAFAVFFKVLLDGTVAFRVDRALGPGTVPADDKPAPAPKVDTQGASLHLLSMLQREGRFLDFVQEDVTSFSDADVGAAARVVHDGCRKTLHQYLTLSPVMTEAEGDAVTVAAGFDPNRVRLTGNVVGNAPFKGTLKHRGWKAADVKLPSAPQGVDLAVLAPAEVEL